MSINREDVERIAELARLHVPEADRERLAAQLSEILEFAEMLQKLDLADCAPGTLTPVGAELREDRPNGRRLSTDHALRGAPFTEDGFFLVPPIVENVNP